jgi:hypothetical protein
MTRPFPGVYADGAPPVSIEADRTQTARPYNFDIPASIAAPPQGGIVARTTHVASRMRTIEGMRGYSTRASLLVRHAASFLGLMLCVAVCHWAFSSIPAWRFGGLVMLYSVTFIFLLAAIGTVVFAEARSDIQNQARHFVFGIIALPGTSMAIFMRIINSELAAPSAQDDMFIAVLRGNALPLAYFTLVVIPAFVFAKYVFGGIRSANRSALTSEETIATYMRHDGWQR